MVVIWVVVVIAIPVWGAIQGAPVDLPGWLFAGAILGVAMTPLVWMRWEMPLIRGRARNARRSLMTVGLGCLWAVVVLVIGASILAATGLD